MTTIKLVSRRLPDREPPQRTETGVCCVTGLKCATLPRKLAIGASFNNWDILRAPHSDRVGLDAWRVLTYSEPNPGKKRDLYPLRNSSWVVTSYDMRYLDRKAVRQLVLDGVNAFCWAGYVTTSYKKHGVLAAPLNAGTQRWLFETTVVDCSDRARVNEYWRRLRSAQDAGIHRPILEALDISPGYIGKVGLERWMEFEKWARPLFRSPLYQFLCYLLPSQEELKQCES